LIRDKFPSERAKFNWSAHSLKHFSILSAQALHLAMSEYASEGHAVENGVSRLFDSIESAVDFAVSNRITNCGLDDFPWLHELPSFVSHLSRDCRQQIQLGFKDGVFSTNQRAAKSTLMSALENPQPPPSPLPNTSVTTTTDTHPLEAVAEPNVQGIAPSSSTPSPMVDNAPYTSSPDRVSVATAIPADGDAARGDAEVTELPNEQHGTLNPGARHGNAHHGMGVNPILLHGASDTFMADFSMPILVPYMVSNGVQVPLPADVLKQAAMHPPLPRMQIDVAFSMGLFVVSVAPRLHVSGTERAFVTVADVLMSIHAKLQEPAVGVDWTAMRASQKTTVAAMRDARCQLHRLAPELEPVRNIDCLDYKTMFAGLVAVGGEADLDHMELVLSPGLVLASPGPSPAHDAAVTPLHPRLEQSQ
jgi:hypothetical protein